MKPLQYLSIVMFVVIAVFGYKYYCSYSVNHSVNQEYFRQVDTDQDIGKQVGSAIGDYRSAHHDHYPDAKHWEDDVRPYWPKISRTSGGPPFPFTAELYSRPGEKHRRFAMNVAYSNKTPKQLKDATEALLYETISDQKNAHGIPTLPGGKYDNPYSAQSVVCFDGREEHKAWGCGSVGRTFR